VRISVLWIFCLAPIAQSATNAYVLIGDSNMGGLGTPVTIVDTAIVANVIRTIPGSNEWTIARGNVHSTQHTTIGPGFAFGRAMATDSPEDTVALVPCARGSSACFQYAPTDHRYRSILDNANWAQGAGGAVLKGAVICFGPNDALYGRGHVFSDDVVAFCERLRTDLGTGMAIVLVDLPIGYQVGSEHADAIRQAQRDLHHGIAWCDHVTTQGLELQDGVHWSATAQRELGRRAAVAMIRLRRAASEAGTVICVR
jgi:hypothetical protein